MSSIALVQSAWVGTVLTFREAVVAAITGEAHCQWRLASQGDGR